MPAEPRPPRLAEFSPEVEALAEISDRLGSLLAVVIGFAGGQQPRMDPYPRPVTAAHRAKKAADWQAHRDLVARVLPRKEGVTDGV